MDREGHVKLTDFGLSRSFESRPALAEDLPAALNQALEAQQAVTANVHAHFNILNRNSPFKIPFKITIASAIFFIL